MGPRYQGRTQDPWLVPILIFVTLGVYGFIWGWRITKETSRVEYGRTDVHRTFKMYLGSTAVFILSYLLVFVVMAADPASAGMFAFLALVIFGSAIATIVFGIMAYHRAFTVVKEGEERAGVRNPLGPGLLVVTSVLIPLGLHYAAYRAQQGLNTMWTAASPPAGGADQAQAAG